MKHTLLISLLLMVLFLGAQLIGLVVIDRYTQVKEVVRVDVERNIVVKEREITYSRLPYDIERPEFEKETSYIPIMIAILIATAISLLLIKFRVLKLWKTWFFLSVGLALLIAFSAFIHEILALILAIVLATIKVFRPNILVQNFTELFIYGGLAGIFVPILNLTSITILLVIVSLYDVIAVWKTKHMVKLAKFQYSTKTFAGLLIPYEIEKQKVKGGKEKRVEQRAILGGGDIGFPLLFMGVVLNNTNFLYATIVSLFATAALLILLLAGNKNKFYPAMPFLSIGCFVGFLSLFLL